MSKDYKKYEVGIRGKQYLTVAGRVALAHDSGRLLGVNMQPYGAYGEKDDEYIAVAATARVLNEQNIPLVERLLTAAGGKVEDGPLAWVIRDLLVSEYTGIAKSPKEGSPAWMKLSPSAPERSNPTEVCATSALGRALGAAGFGDTESFASADEITIAQNRQASYSNSGESSGASSASSSYTSRASTTKGPSDKQKKYLATLTKQKLGISTPEEFQALAKTKFGKTIDELSARDVSEWIDELASEAG